MENFKQIEPQENCPPELGTELISEIDFIRHSLRVVALYAYDIFSVLTTHLGDMQPPHSPRNDL